MSILVEHFKLIVDDIINFEALREAIKGHDLVFHLASNPDIAKSFENPYLDMEKGIIATYNILNAMRLERIKEIVYTSGSGVYGDQGVGYTAEDFGPLLPISMYGASKLASEGLISAFCFMYDMKSWIFRPANIVGSQLRYVFLFLISSNVPWTAKGITKGTINIR